MLIYFDVCDDHCYSQCIMTSCFMCRVTDEIINLKGSFLQDHQHKQDDSSSSISNMSLIPVISVLNIGWFRRNKNKITVISGTFTLFCFLRTISHVIYIYMYFFFFLWNMFSNLSIQIWYLIVNFNFRRNEYSFNQNISQINKVPLCIFMPGGNTRQLTSETSAILLKRDL